jgi:hypothetical protein
MAVYPGARYRPIAPGTNDPPIIVLGAILHVDAGNSKSLFGYFSGPSGGIESHFHVPKEYQVEQYRDTGFEADANYKANSFWKDGKRYGYVSIETQGYGAGEWNAYQIAEIKKLLLWLSKTHGFPLVRCPAHMSPGVGYHIMFGSPGPWTPVNKSCPGPDRIKQFNNILVPWMKTTDAVDPIGQAAPNITISTKAIVMAYRGDPITDTFEADARQFLAWARVLGISAPLVESAWLKVHNTDPAEGARLFRLVLHAVQQRFGIAEGANNILDAILVMKRYGYVVISYDGTVI